MLLKFCQVYVCVSVCDSQISDESDSCEFVFFQCQLLVSFEKEDVLVVYVIEEGEVLFGFEFLSKVILWDINFGKMVDDVNELMIVGEVKK